MTERELTRLLDEAVPPIPAEFADAPYPSIRGRARRRRAVSTAVACGAVALAVGLVAAGIAAAPWRSAAPPPPAAPTIEPTQPLLTVAVPEARVGRAGTGLTFYVNPDRANCLSYQDLTPVVDELAGQVVVRFSGTGTTTACDQVRAAKIGATLAEPLGDRALLDASGDPIRPFFDADLPVLPSSWQEMPGGVEGLDGSWIIVPYQDVTTHRVVRIDAWTRQQPYPADAGEVTLGSRTGSLFAIGQTVGVRWRVRDLYYELKPIPNEGDDATLDNVRALIDEFIWP